MDVITGSDHSVNYTTTYVVFLSMHIMFYVNGLENRETESEREREREFVCEREMGCVRKRDISKIYVSWLCLHQP